MGLRATELEEALMVIESLDGVFAICKVEDFSRLNLDAPFCFVGKTDCEHSLVCLSDDVPDNATAVDSGWRALRVQGPLDLSLTGILAGIADKLADAEIPLFAVSTFDTDYILVKEEDFKRALAILG